MCDNEKVYDVTPDNIVKEDIPAGAVVSVSLTSELLDGTIIKPPRLKKYVYKHAHDCTWKNQLYDYYPATVGAVMFPIAPVCIETGIELMRVRVEDV